MRYQLSQFVPWKQAEFQLSDAQFVNKLTEMLCILFAIRWSCNNQSCLPRRFRSQQLSVGPPNAKACGS
jgi:hypothetical protein